MKKKISSDFILQRHRSAFYPSDRDWDGDAEMEKDLEQLHRP